MRDRKKVVIVGAGFAGLNLARALEGSGLAVHLIDRNNYHTFQPLLYQVATGFLEANSIGNNIRSIFQDRADVSFTMGEARDVDPGRRRLLVQTVGGSLETVGYDYLVLATGMMTDFFGVPGAHHAFTLKSLDDAIRLRNQIVRQFEAAEAREAGAGGAAAPGGAAAAPRGMPASDGAEDGALTFAIIGGGATGIELAGAMCDLLRHTFRQQFPEGLVSRARIVLVEALPRLLDAFAAESGEYARRLLEERGVEILPGDGVVAVDQDGLTLRSGRRVEARTVIWVAGVRAGGLVAGLPDGHARAGRVVVAPDLSLRRQPDIFVAGDAAAAWDRAGQLYPLLAPVALQQGRHVARQIQRRAAGLPTEPFDYKDRGVMSTVGRNAAIAELPGGLRFYGFPAWTMWLGLHLVELIGFRNRANVLLDWGWNYVTHHQGSGLMQCEGLPPAPAPPARPAESPPRSV